MKTKSVFFIALLLTGFVANASSENPGIKTSINSANKKLVANFGRLQAHRQQQGVGLSWTVLSTEGVAGFVIERSYDGTYFEEIDQVNCEITGRHRYNDNAVYPGYLHYRVVAIMNDGTSETSETTVVRIVSRK